jgi:hypothetical protein
MTTILEAGSTWQERVYGVFDPETSRLVETFGPDGYTDYDGDVLPITREYTVAGTRWDRFGNLINTTKYVESVNGAPLEVRDDGTYLAQAVTA